MKTKNTTEQLRITIENGNEIGGIKLTNDVHLIYAGCPSCGADLEKKEVTTDDHGWIWFEWWCPACSKYIDSPHFAVFPAMKKIIEKIVNR
jgi:hypothetical protein